MHGTQTHSGLITHYDPRSPVAEAYRTLRTNIQFAAVDTPLRSILFTSATPAEGKSLTCANLAVAMAQTGKQIILVDADLRRPALHRLFHCANTVGLSNFIVGEADLEQALQPTEVEGLFLLPSGPLPPNPAELLGSQGMGKVLRVLEDRSDLVIIDTPPVLAVTDAQVLAGRVSGCILVITAAGVRQEVALRAKTALEHAQARLLGAVLNNAPGEGTGYYYYYYYTSENPAAEEG